MILPSPVWLGYVGSASRQLPCYPRPCLCCRNPIPFDLLYR